MDKITVVDVEPMIIEYEDASVKWVHPFISEWFEPDDCDTDNEVYEAKIINNEDMKMAMCFKSRYMDQQISEYFSRDDWKTSPVHLFQKPFVDMQAVVNTIGRIMWNGTWMARKPPDSPAKTNRDLLEWSQTTSRKQFHGTTKGDKIAAFFQSGYRCKLDMFCYLETDGKDWFYDIGD